MARACHRSSSLGVLDALALSAGVVVLVAVLVGGTCMELGHGTFLLSGHHPWVYLIGAGGLVLLRPAAEVPPLSGVKHLYPVAASASAEAATGVCVRHESASRDQQVRILPRY